MSKRPPRRAGIDREALLDEARRARRRAHAPYSRFKVGAALLTRDGNVIHGCNVENASYGLTICAERNAVFQAVALGLEGFTAIAIVTKAGKSASPCGACRQVLHEFAPKMRVIWRDAGGRLIDRTVDQLLPNAFVFKKGTK